MDVRQYQTPGATFWTLGCPFSCTYCTVGGMKPIGRPLSQVLAEWNEARRQGCDTLALLDDEVLHNRARVAELVSALESGRCFHNVKLCLQSRVDSVLARFGDGWLDRLRRAVGRLYLEMGVDGLTETDIRNVRKGGKATVQSPFEVIGVASNLNIEIGFGSILGFPWNTMEQLEQQSSYARSLLDRAKEHGVTAAVMGGAFTPFPGSALGKEVIEGRFEGASVVHLDPEHFDFHRPNVDTMFWNHGYLERFLVRHFERMMED